MSASENVVVIGRWQTNEQTLSEVLKLVADLQVQSLAEPGCLGYEVFHRTDDPAALLLLERYLDNTALESHRSSKHYRELVTGRILPMLKDRRVEFLSARE